MEIRKKEKSADSCFTLAFYRVTYSVGTSLLRSNYYSVLIAVDRARVAHKRLDNPFVSLLISREGRDRGGWEKFIEKEKKVIVNPRARAHARVC